MKEFAKMRLSIILGVFFAIISIVVSQDADKYTFDCHRIRNSCKNGGTCGDSKTCKCPVGFEGYDCNFLNSSELCGTGPNITDPCLNGGICYKDSTNNSVALCYCKYGYRGDTCEEEIVDITCEGVTAEYSLSFPIDFVGKVVLVDENGTSLEDDCPINETKSDRKTFVLEVDLTDDGSQSSVNCKVANIQQLNETYQANLRVYYDSILVTNIDEVYRLNCTHTTAGDDVSIDIKNVKVNNEDLDQVDGSETFTPFVLEPVDENDTAVGPELALGEDIRLHLYPSLDSGYTDVRFETCTANNTLTGENNETMMSLKFLDQGCPTQEGMIIYTAQERKNKTITINSEDTIVQGKAVKFSAFKFSNSDNIGVVCRVTACRPGSSNCDLPTNCAAIMNGVTDTEQTNDDNNDNGTTTTTEAATVAGRRKRAAEDDDDEETVSKVFTIVGKREKINEKTSEAESVDPLEECMARTEITAVIAILGAVVCVLLVVCFFLACIILRRRGKRSTTYDPTLFQPKPDRFQIPRAHVNESYEIM
ncbi:EGF-like domain-containing protein 2 isoform X2 [Mercenaria mercenaria]|uniref:EGF-like domain-containing protein 2 isoform X2 n=1 Tax=Mercenaria mercenaria TaxID=6596 RepID=UPI00234EEF61|nr:EGF-like domain-containing protein 2 isoform X2 [Mercenaria mercenaria]